MPIRSLTFSEQQWAAVMKESARVGISAAAVVRRVITKHLKADCVTCREKPVAPVPGLDTVKFRAGTTVAQVERELIRQTLKATNQNRTHAARLLGVCLKTLHNKLTEYEAVRKAA